VFLEKNIINGLIKIYKCI